MKSSPKQKLEAIKASGYNFNKASKLLKVSKQGLYRWFKRRYPISDIKTLKYNHMLETLRAQRGDVKSAAKQLSVTTYAIYKSLKRHKKKPTVNK